jgi:hypothetical protein
MKDHARRSTADHKAGKDYKDSRSFFARFVVKGKRKCIPFAAILKGKPRRRRPAFTATAEAADPCSAEHGRGQLAGEKDGVTAAHGRGSGNELYHFQIELHK